MGLFQTAFSLRSMIAYIDDFIFYRKLMMAWEGIWLNDRESRASQVRKRIYVGTKMPLPMASKEIEEMQKGGMRF